MLGEDPFRYNLYSIKTQGVYPDPRYAACVFRVRDSLVMLGGISTATFHSSVFSYNISQNRWDVVVNQPFGQYHGQLCIQYESKMYMISGQEVFIMPFFLNKLQTFFRENTNHHLNDIN
jgi:hypothetical protein